METVGLGEVEINSPVFRALEKGSCPHLRDVGLPLSLSTTDVDAFARAIRQGANPTLEVLRLVWSMDEQLATVLSALSYLRAVVAEQAGGDALARALSSGYCQRLKKLDVGGFGHHASCLRVLEAIRHGACPHLGELDFQRSDAIDDESAKVLGEALDAGVCTELARLDVSECEDLGDEGVVSIVDGIKRGRCCNFKKLGLGGTGIRPVGVHALAQAVETAPLCRLKLLALVGKLTCSCCCCWWWWW